MKQINFAIFLGVTFVWVVFWIIFNVYHSLTTSSINDVLQQEITPIDAQFDQSTIDMIKNRHQIPLIYSLGGIATNPLSSTSGSLTPSPVVSPTPTGGQP